MRSRDGSRTAGLHRRLGNLAPAGSTKTLSGCRGVAGHAAWWTDELKQRLQRISLNGLDRDLRTDEDGVKRGDRARFRRIVQPR